MTVLSELLPMMITMAVNKNIGTINLTNPGVINHEDMLKLYKKYVKSSITYELMSLEELKKYTTAGRSNNYLDTTKLQKLCPNVKEIHESVTDLFKGMH